MTNINNRHNERIRELDNQRHKDDLIHTENMDRQNKDFQLNMEIQNNSHQQRMDQQNKDFQLNMNQQNNIHVENLKRIENEGQLLNYQHQCQMECLKNERNQNDNQHREKMEKENNQHDEKMQTLNSNHQEKLQQIISKTESDKFDHEKEITQM